MAVFEHVLFPAWCPACDIPVVRSFCTHCRAGVRPWQPASCLRCGADRADRCVCPWLPDRVLGFEALWQLRGPVRDLIEYAKYRGEIWRIGRVKREVRGWLAAICHPLAPATVVPVPPSRRRLRARGFDLPSLLARWAARPRGVRLRFRPLYRLEASGQQAALGREARLAQAERLFRARPAPKTVVLIDDVITTGATMAACARALAAAGAQRILGVALARTPSEGEQ
jgi:ComF family protein